MEINLIFLCQSFAVVFNVFWEYFRYYFHNCKENTHGVFFFEILEPLHFSFYFGKSQIKSNCTESERTSRNNFAWLPTSLILFKHIDNKDEFTSFEGAARMRMR